MKQVFADRRIDDGGDKAMWSPNRIFFSSGAQSYLQLRAPFAVKCGHVSGFWPMASG